LQSEVGSSASRLHGHTSKKFGTQTKEKLDINSLYDQVELQLPSMKVKRKLRILGKEALSPHKLLPSIKEANETHAYGRPNPK
jgi:hypothetical protein